MIIETSVLNNRYRLDKKVGQGGFAQVFLATDLLLERRVALKVLNSELTEDGDFQERFTREAKAIATLDHPHILPIYDYGQAEGTAYLVTPFVDGGTLYEKMRAERNIPPSLALRYLQQMASALDYAHRRNIVHRDIKPHNMLLRAEDNHLFLADFGIAKVLSSASSQSRTSAIGTISYMSPEQLAGNVGKATDIYSLGCVLFQMLTGQVPYTGPTEQVIMGHINGEIPSVVERSNGRLSPAMQQVFNRALAKRPENRYPTATEMALAFEMALNNGTAGITSPLPENFISPNTPTAYAPTEVRIPPVNLTAYRQPQGSPNPDGQGYAQPNQTPPHGYGNTPGFRTPPNPQPALNAPAHSYTGPHPAPVIPPAYGPDGGNGYPPGYGWNNGPGAPQPPQKSGTNWLLITLGGVVILALLGVIAFLVISNNSPKPTPTATVVAGVPTATTAVPVTTAPATTATAPTTPANLSTVTPGPSTTAALETTAPATTVAPTTAAPTPTTAAPTTLPPTTVAPTTVAPTTPPKTTQPVTPTPAIPPLKINKAAISQALQSLPGATSVFIIYPDGSYTSDDGDRAQPSASVIKLWIAATAFQDAKAGRFSLGEKYTVQKTDIASGTGILVNNVGKTFTYEQILTTMLTYSDNSAANIVIRKLGGFDRVNAYAQANGYTNTRLQRLLGDTSNPNNNFTSGKDAATMMYLLSEGKIVDGNSSLTILQALYDRRNYNADQNFFSSQLSAGYQKDNYLHISGTGTKVRNEVGLVPILNANNMIIAILDTDMPDEGAAETAIASAVGVISGAVSR
jgi:serine/threonine-protein kinase